MDGIIKFYNKDTLLERTVDTGNKSYSKWSDMIIKPL